MLTAEPENIKSAGMTETQLKRLMEYGVGGGAKNFSVHIKHFSVKIVHDALSAQNCTICIDVTELVCKVSELISNSFGTQF